jgi:hypothetical protein
MKTFAQQIGHSMSIPFQSSREEYPAALEAFGDWNCLGLGVR